MKSLVSMLGASTRRNLFRTLPGISTKTYAAWPVWSDSARKPVPFYPVSKKLTNVWYQKARTWNRTKAARRYGGTLGSAGIRVLEALVYDFLNYSTGQLDPSYEGLARKTGLGRSTVWRALARLKELGIVHWVRRCTAEWIDDHYELRQDTNAYAVQPPTQWRGFTDPKPGAPAPHPSAWGAATPIPDVFEQAVLERRSGGSLTAVARVLATDDRSPLAQAFARFARTMAASPPKKG